MEQIKVMLVDDDHLVLHDLQRMIDWQGLGFNIEEIAYNGKLGIDRYEKSKPQIIFTDIKMPIMDGIDMMKAIKKSNENVLFVILSAYGEFEYAQQAIQLGAHAYILKDELSTESLQSLVISLKKMVCQQAANTFISICNAVNSYLRDVNQDPESIYEKWDGLFSRYRDYGEDGWDLKSLSGKLADLIKTAYDKYGMSTLYHQPEAMGKGDLCRWACDHARLIHRWRPDAQEGANPAVYKAIQFIDGNYNDKDLSIQKIADVLQISESWLSVCFKKVVGLTINEHIKKTRIDKAKELLQRGEHMVYEVADLVGFSSSQYFSKVFCQIVKQTPYQYQRGL